MSINNARMIVIFSFTCHANKQISIDFIFLCPERYPTDPNETTRPVHPAPPVLLTKNGTWNSATKQLVNMHKIPEQNYESIPHIWILSMVINYSEDEQYMDIFQTGTISF